MSRSSATASRAITRCPTAKSAPPCWRWVEFAGCNGRRWRALHEDETAETMVQVAAATMSEEAFIGGSPVSSHGP